MPMSQRRLPDEVDAKRCSTFIRDEFVQRNKASLADWGHGVKVCPLARKDSVLAIYVTEVGSHVNRLYSQRGSEIG